jgi:hypothetical protein
MRGRIHPVMRYKLSQRAHARRSGLGQQIDPASGMPIMDLEAGTYAPGPPALPPDTWFTNTFGQGAAPSGLLFSAATGNVSPAQKQNLIAQQTAAMIKAGADPATAAAQASSDVTTTLMTASGPGAFGVPWTGADPSQAWTTQLSNWLQTPDASLGVPMWMWLAGGGLAIWLLAKR